MTEAVRRHRGPVFAFARRLVGDSGRAEEISQEVFLRLWERSSRFDERRRVDAPRSSSRSPIAGRSTSSDPILARQAGEGDAIRKPSRRPQSKQRSLRRPSPRPSTALCRSFRTMSDRQSNSRISGATVIGRSHKCSTSPKARSKAASAAAWGGSVQRSRPKTCMVRDTPTPVFSVQLSAARNASPPRCSSPVIASASAASAELT